MTLQYRGHQYEMMPAIQRRREETIEGQYKGHKSSISLPRLKAINLGKTLLMYRGTPLAV